MEFWILPNDILMIICSVLILVFSSLFLLIILIDKTCHTNTMILVGNTFSIGLILGYVLIHSSIFIYLNDLENNLIEDSLCIIRAYIGYVSYTLMNCSFVLQALNRYLLVLYLTRLYYQKKQFLIISICLTWIYSISYQLPLILTSYVIFNADNQICQVPLGLSFLSIYGSFFGYVVPISLVIFIYWKLVRYVRRMNDHITPVNTLNRARNQLKMVRRTVLLVLILMTICLPYTLIMFMSFFNCAPKYHYRISYIFVYTAILCVIIALFQFTDSLKKSIRKLLR